MEDMWESYTLIAWLIPKALHRENSPQEHSWVIPSWTECVSYELNQNEMLFHYGKVNRGADTTARVLRSSSYTKFYYFINFKNMFYIKQATSKKLSW